MKLDLHWPPYMTVKCDEGCRYNPLLSLMTHSETCGAPHDKGALLVGDVVVEASDRETFVKKVAQEAVNAAITKLVESVPEVTEEPWSQGDSFLGMTQETWGKEVERFQQLLEAKIRWSMWRRLP